MMPALFIPASDDPFTTAWLWRRIGDFCSSGMSVVSLKFLFFVAMAILVYFLTPRKWRQWVLLASSAFFYCLFSLKSAAFLGISALSVYLCGLAVGAKKLPRLALSVTVMFNLSLLVYAKYGGVICPGRSIVVPLGISFYTLQAIAYTVDVARGTCASERNPFKLLLFLTFFPCIMQGPISRFGQLADQLWEGHRFSLDRLRDGLQLALWGFFKKMVIADRAAIFVNSVFATDAKADGFMIVIASFLYAAQIYADFSGCVDISRGIAQCLGIDLVNNFERPYFASSIKDFWRRWHISLSSWLKDYVYIPLGGNRHGTFRKHLNVLLVFAVSGLWHGTGFNFFIWGVLHGVYQIFDSSTSGLRKRFYERCGIVRETFSFIWGERVLTFVLVTFAWIFFRAQDAAQAFSLIRRMFVFNPWVLTDGSVSKFGLETADWFILLCAFLVLLTVSLLKERGFRLRESLNRQMLPFRWAVVILAITATLLTGIYGPGYSAAQFIYMQF